MKQPRRKKPDTKHRHRVKSDPVTDFLDATLKEGEYRAFHCGIHGKFLFKPEGRADCPVCGAPCFTPDEWGIRRQSLRQRRMERVSKLRNHLE